jgi:hypothetical protein
LIKSIVQVCEDIVHVDPLTSSIPSSSTAILSKQFATEIHASTKPYPAWWSDVDESKVLRRRKRMGDAVLERNVCFVEIGSVEEGATMTRYLEQQLDKAIVAPTSSSNDFIGMLSGRGGAQVDVVLYLVSSGMSSCSAYDGLVPCSVSYLLIIHRHLSGGLRAHTATLRDGQRCSRPEQDRPTFTRRNSKLEESMSAEASCLSDRAIQRGRLTLFTRLSNLPLCHLLHS